MRKYDILSNLKLLTILEKGFWEFYTGAQNIFWALWLFIWQPLRRRPELFEAMSSLMNSSAWAAIFLFLGMLQIYAVVAIDHVRLRTTLVLIQVGLWAFVTAMFFQDVPISFTGMVYFCITVFNTLAYIRLVNYGKYERLFS